MSRFRKTDDDGDFFVDDEKFYPTKKLANRYSAWMDQDWVSEVKLQQVEYSENQFGKPVEKLSDISKEEESVNEVWVLLRSGKKNDPYTH